MYVFVCMYERLYVRMHVDMHVIVCVSKVYVLNASVEHTISSNFKTCCNYRTTKIKLLLQISTSVESGTRAV